MRKKVSRLLLYVALCTVCAVTKAQNVSKSFENQSLKSVLTEIEHQTGLSIIYELKEVDETKKITGYFKNTPVEQVLSEILDKDLTFTIRNKMILLSKRKNEKRQQEGVKRVTGKVIDEKGEAVIGATVLVKGTTNGTITDVDGIFTLDNVAVRCVDCYILYRLSRPGVVGERQTICQRYLIRGFQTAG